MGPETLIALIGLCLMALVHLVGFVIWASRLTMRVSHIEVWIEQNQQTGDRLTKIETSLEGIGRELRDIKDALPKAGRRAGDDG